MKLWWMVAALGVGLIAIVLGLDLAFDAGIVPWVLIVGLFLGLFVVLGVRVVRATWRGFKAGLRGEKNGPPTVQTILFRVVLVALFALFACVMVVLWWNDRSDSRDPFFGGPEQALAVLDIAYQAQPVRDVADVNEDSGAPSVTGIWFDRAAYESIRSALEQPPLSSTGPQTFLLNGRDMQPPRTILPPSVYAEYKGDGPNNIMIPGYSFPFEMLPSEMSTRQMRAAERVWLDYIKEHGWKVGWHGSGEDRVRYAMWRTGPNTAAYVLGHADSGTQVAWYLKPLEWGWQAMFLYIFLAPFAAVAAWYLSRKITRPVGRVAAASKVLAAGSHPDPIPVEGPAELATMARSFNRLSDRLAKAQAAQREFVASVSHELKTPLTSLQGYGELLTDGAVSGEEAGPVVLAESARLERLVGDLLESARMDSGQFSIRDEVVSLDRVAGAVVRRCSATADAFEISLAVRRDAEDDTPGDVLVEADEDRLVQVVSNLVENALRCTPSGGSVAIVVCGPASIRVVDTGPGLAAADVPHAFERFYLYEKYGKDRPVGTGLGLSIVRDLVEAMDGSVTLTSEPGAGSVFAIELRPAGDELPAGVASPGSAVETSRPGESPVRESDV